MISDSTIDPKEVEYYTRMAESWWDREGAFWPLHKLNELRTDYIINKLCGFYERNTDTEKPLEGLRILDVGCGGGILSESMAKAGAVVTGIDVVEKNIQIASLHAKQEELDIHYCLTTASQLVETGAQFDVVLNMEVVEHVADVDAFMLDCARLTGPEGVMFVATINRTWLAWLVAIVGAEYVLGLLPKGTHRWSMFQKPDEIATHLKRAGISVEDSIGVAVNPFKRTLRTTPFMAVNYMLFCTA
ncbi:MAG: bifunctional 2-polyprenyl-6-hydroxyphenol methylase/3-demethylubiquinol 3-O-methyltransferase UbiG [Gammaproteobacteria bacterium]